MNDDAKLEQIRQRVDQASTRNARRLAERAGEARDGAVAFVAEHPLATVAGGIAVGALIAAVLPRWSKHDKAGAKATAKPAAWIGILAQAGALRLVEGCGQLAIATGSNGFNQHAAHAATGTGHGDAKRV